MGVVVGALGSERESRGGRYLMREAISMHALSMHSARTHHALITHSSRARHALITHSACTHTHQMIPSSVCMYR